MPGSKKIVCIHLLNDFSGSPRILSQVAHAFIGEGHEVDIFTSNKSGEGFLTHVRGATQRFFFYRWSRFKLLTVLFFFFSQCVLFTKLLAYRKTKAVFYVNTVLPFGAALAGKLLGKKVVYHIHETSIKPAPLKWFLFFIARKTAAEAIYVSHYLMEQEPLRAVRCHVVYNALSREFVAVSRLRKPVLNGTFNILMLSSLKDYKGVNEFVGLAELLQTFRFEMVLNASQSEIDQFFKTKSLPRNLTIFPSQSDVHPFYQRAHLVLNLSHPLKWVETFGMTALEAMSYGVPVIVPPVGGIAELVTDHVNGYKIDVRDMEALRTAILNLQGDRERYGILSQRAKQRSQEFDQTTMSVQILKIATD